MDEQTKVLLIVMAPFMVMFVLGVIALAFLRRNYHRHLEELRGQEQQPHGPTT